MTDEKIKTLLKAALPLAGDGELQNDLWPAMLQRIGAEEARRIRFTRWDWVIAGLVAASIFISPSLIPRLLYHL